MCHGVGFLHLTDHGVPARVHRALLQSARAVLRAAGEHQGAHRQAPVAALPRVGARGRRAHQQPRRLPRAARCAAASTRRIRPTPSRRTSGSMARTNGCPSTSCPGFHAAVDEFFDRLGAVAWELMEVMSVGLGLPPPSPARRSSASGRCRSPSSSAIHAPQPARRASTRTTTPASSHCCCSTGWAGCRRWHPTASGSTYRPARRRFIVNIGEMLQAMTGNYFVACTHRVIATEPRFSTAYFHGPDLRTPLAPLSCPALRRRRRRQSHAIASPASWPSATNCSTGQADIASESAQVFGQQMWNYYVRSYPEWSSSTIPAQSDPVSRRPVECRAHRGVEVLERHRRLGADHQLGVGAHRVAQHARPFGGGLVDRVGHLLGRRFTVDQAALRRPEPLPPLRTRRCRRPSPPTSGCCRRAAWRTGPARPPHTRMPCCDSSKCIASVSASTACLLAAYIPPYGVPTSPASEPTLTMVPPPLASMCGTTARTTRTTPVTLVSNCHAPPRRVNRCTAPNISTPALLTTTSSWPASSMACGDRRVHAVGAAHVERELVDVGAGVQRGRLAGRAHGGEHTVAAVGEGERGELTEPAAAPCDENVRHSLRTYSGYGRPMSTPRRVGGGRDLRPRLRQTRQNGSRCSSGSHAHGVPLPEIVGVCRGRSAHLARRRPQPPARPANARCATSPRHRHSTSRWSTTSAGPPACRSSASTSDVYTDDDLPMFELFAQAVAAVQPRRAGALHPRHGHRDAARRRGRGRDVPPRRGGTHLRGARRTPARGGEGQPTRASSWRVPPPACSSPCSARTSSSRRRPCAAPGEGMRRLRHAAARPSASSTSAGSPPRRARSTRRSCSTW